MDRNESARFEQLIEDLKKGSGLKRAQAAVDLGKLKDKRASKPLREALSDPNAGVRGNAAFALGEVGSTDATPSLVSALLGDAEEWVRKSAAKALGILGSRKAVLPLIQALDDASHMVRKNAARSLGLIGGPDALQALTRVLSDQDPILTKIARDAIERLKADKDGTGRTNRIG